MSQLSKAVDRCLGLFRSLNYGMTVGSCGYANWINPEKAQSSCPCLPQIAGEVFALRMRKLMATPQRL